MFVAITESGRRVISVETDKDEGPFFCPGCQTELILKKGMVRTDHFAHLHSVVCEYHAQLMGKVESPEHYFRKFEIYRSLRSNPKCKNVQIEYVIGDSRADVYAEVDGNPVAADAQIL